MLIWRHSLASIWQQNCYHHQWRKRGVGGSKQLGHLQNPAHTGWPRELHFDPESIHWNRWEAILPWTRSPIINFYVIQFSNHTTSLYLRALKRCVTCEMVKKPLHTSRATCPQLTVSSGPLYALRNSVSGVTVLKQNHKFLIVLILQVQNKH